MSNFQKHTFNTTPAVDIQRSKFDRSHSLKTTFDADRLIPILVDEVLPGDTHILKENLFGRLSTPIKPIFDQMYLDTFYFFVPMRLVWENAERFFGAQDNPDDSIDFTIPTITSSNSVQQLCDYFGVPPQLGSNITINSLPIRAYWLIYDEWFRDQNLQEKANIRLDDGSQPLLNTDEYDWWTPAFRGKRHDYFTSCLPWAQKGEPVSVPLGEKAYITTDAGLTTDVTVVSSVNSDASYDLRMDGGSAIELGILQSSAPNTKNLYADLTSASSASINEWRTAFQIQKFLERNARGGTRYIEMIKSHFNVTSSDARLQRPEYLGGGSSPINVHPVAQTSQTSTTAQGNLSAFGTVSSGGNGFTKSFEEHGYIIGLANVRTDLSYQQGLHKMWSRSTLYDFYFPTFAHLGEQAVLNKEIYVQGTSADDDVFGYQERYAEYRYKPSQITGFMRSGVTNSLDVWHLAQEFNSLPTLGKDFIISDTDVDRVIAVPAEPHILLDGYFDYKSIRPMPAYAPPGFIDHF
jgi:hypothetical protein